MCGRFTKNYTWQQIQALYCLTVPAAIPNMQPSFNVCPPDTRAAAAPMFDVAVAEVPVPAQLGRDALQKRPARLNW